MLTTFTVSVDRYQVKRRSARLRRFRAGRAVSGLSRGPIRDEPCGELDHDRGGELGRPGANRVRSLSLGRRLDIGGLPVSQLTLGALLFGGSLLLVLHRLVAERLDLRRQKRSADAEWWIARKPDPSWRAKINGRKWHYCKLRRDSYAPGSATTSEPPGLSG